MTAVRIWLSSGRLCQLAVALLAATACAALPVAQATPPAKGAASDARLASPNSPSAKGGSPSPIAGVPDPSARCFSSPGAGPYVLIGQALYNVADPVHPQLMCLIKNTVAHLYTQDTFAYLRRSGDEATEVVLRSMGSGNESVVAGWTLKLLEGPFGKVGSWTPDGNEAASAVGGTDASGNPTIQIWLFNESLQPKKRMLYDFLQPLTDCICRFGLAPPTLAFSADGQYLVSAWPIGKGAAPLHIYRAADASLMQTLDMIDGQAFWSPTGHRLYVTTRRDAPQSWTPELGLQSLDGSNAWVFMPGISPDGAWVAYTAGLPPDSLSPPTLRVYVYDHVAHKTRMLTDQARSEVTFVRDGWVWYREEAPCTSCPGPTGPTDKVFAMDLSTGVETPVVFTSGESPSSLDSGWSTGQFWPSS